MSDDKSNCEMPPPMSSSSEIAPSTDSDTLLLSNSQSIPNATPSPVEPAASALSTPALSITGGPTSRLRAPTNYSSDIAVSVSKIGRLCSHAASKTGPPPRDDPERSSADNADAPFFRGTAGNGVVMTAILIFFLKMLQKVY